MLIISIIILSLATILFFFQGYIFILRTIEGDRSKYLICNKTYNCNKYKSDYNIPSENSISRIIWEEPPKGIFQWKQSKNLCFFLHLILCVNSHTLSISFYMWRYQYAIIITICVFHCHSYSNRIPI